MGWHNLYKVELDPRIMPILQGKVYFTPDNRQVVDIGCCIYLGIPYIIVSLGIWSWLYSFWEAQNSCTLVRWVLTILLPNRSVRGTGHDDSLIKEVQEVSHVTTPSWKRCKRLCTLQLPHERGVRGPERYDSLMK